MRRWPMLLAAIAVWASAWSGFVPAARAVPPETTGWWWFAAEGTTPRNHANLPPGSLFVAAQPQGTANPTYQPEGAAAVSALRLAVADDTSVGELVLTIDRSRTPPSQAPIAVQACPTNSAWQPAEGASLTAAPRGDCSTGLAFGIVDGDKVRFALGGLVRDGYLNVVVMPQETTTTVTTPYNVPQPPADPRFPPPPPTYPTTIPSATATTEPTTAPFEVVFVKPGPEAITVTTYPRGEEFGGEEEFNPFLSAEFTASIGIAPPPYSAEFSVPPPIVNTPAPPAAGPSRRRGRSLPPARNIVQEDVRDPKVLMAMVATGLVLLYLGLLGSSGPLRRLPGPIGRVLPEPEGPLNRGIGRFARPRERPPVRL